MSIKKYNLSVLKSFVASNKDHFNRMSHSEMKEEILSHGWDPAVIETALEEEE